MTVGRGEQGDFVCRFLPPRHQRTDACRI